MNIEDNKELTCCNSLSNTYCFQSTCKSYVCNKCLYKHKEHCYIPLNELSQNIKSLAEKELPQLNKVIEHENKHIRFLKEGGDEVTKGINDLKSNIVNILWEIYRLVNSCLSDEIQSQLFYLSKIKEKTKEI